MIKKNVVAIFSFIITFCFVYSPVGATEGLHFDIGDDNSIAVLAEKDNWAIEEESIEGILPAVVFSLGHSSLGVNKYIKSSYAYNIKRGEKVKIQSLTWRPTGQKVQLGFINANNGNQYWTNNYTGGSKNGGTFSLGGPSGSYYIAIGTPSTNSQAINIRGQFEF